MLQNEFESDLLTMKASTAIFLAILITALHATLVRAEMADCVVQAFGKGLRGKGIKVTVKQHGFGCPNVWPWNDKAADAKFGSKFPDEAEVSLKLHVSHFKVCMTEMLIEVDLPYECTPLKRRVHTADWSNILHGGQGSCRALEQKCDSKVTTAAVPYIDMWCRVPSGMIHAGFPMEMRLNWQGSSKDKCV